MADWRVEFSKEACKSYQKLEIGYKAKIDQVLNWLIQHKRVDIKPIEGEKDIYRIRVGRYRILIKLNNEKNVILVTRIKARGNIYR